MQKLIEPKRTAFRTRILSGVRYGSLALAITFAAATSGFFSSNVAFGQAVSVNGGSIQGTITDESGAVVGNASITISNKETGFSKQLQTDGAGYYSLGPLNPGTYQVSIQASGFSKLVVETVVRTGTATPGSYKLTVGQSSTEITVTAGAVQVNTDQPGVSGVISSQQLSTLPVNGRNILDYAQLQPGVQLQPGGYQDGGFDPTKAGYSALSFSGVSGRTTRILLDGQDVTDETVGTTIFNISTGSVGDMQVNRSTSDPSTEITSSGSVLMSTASGTNSYHGQLFYDFQDQRVGSASFQGISNPFQRNQFGGSIGGPILKDKLFFFANVERLKQDQQAGIALGSLFTGIQTDHPQVGSPDRDTYSAGRLDYNGFHGTHFFARINYEANSFDTGTGYSTYANRDNAPGIAGGADFTTGRFTHSFRGSYEKFHNLIGDTTNGNNSLYNPIPGMYISYAAQELRTGPNPNAPQQTFQSDKQLRYDGSWLKGAHNIRYGASVNRILGGGLAAFFGYGPEASLNSSSGFTGPTANNPQALGCGGVAGAAPCLDDPANGYHANLLVVSNGLGYASEKPGFGLPGGFQGDWRVGIYFADSWKVTPTFTLSYGIRYQRDTGRSNSDLAPVPCSDLVTANFDFGTSGPPCTGSSQMFDMWGAGLGNRVDQPNYNFGPQIGFAYNPAASPKTVLRGGFGIYYESNVFNNVQFDRASRLPVGEFAQYPTICAGTYNLGNLTSNSNGVSIQQMCNESLAVAAPQIFQLQTDYRQQSGPGANSAFAGQSLSIQSGTIAFAPKFKSPYSINFNFGIQRELATGLVLSADYVHIGTLRISQTIDANHVGDSRYLNVAAAQAAIAATLTACGASDINAAIAPGGCPGGSGPSNNASITDFAQKGLDSGVSYNGGYPASYAGQVAAFGGINPNVGVGTFSFPEGKSGYDGLQMNLREQKAHPMPGVVQSNLEVSYAYSRFISSGGVGGTGSTSDQFFSAPSYNNRNISQVMGYGNLDRTHIFSVGGSAQFKYGPRLALIAHLESAAPTNLNIDTQGGNPGEIFRSDVDGDGQTGDLMPGTGPGAYMRQYGPNNLNKLINNYNASSAGRLTPAGNALVTAGLFNANQLVALGAVVPKLANAPAHAFPNSPVRTMDANFSYPIRAKWLPEQMSIEPAVAIYNVLNLANFNDLSSNDTGIIQTADDLSSGNVNGPYDFAAKNAVRVPRRTGTFDQGAPRTTEFQLKFNF